MSLRTTTPYENTEQYQQAMEAFLCSSEDASLWTGTPQSIALVDSNPTVGFGFDMQKEYARLGEGIYGLINSFITDSDRQLTALAQRYMTAYILQQPTIDLGSDLGVRPYI